MASDAMGSVVTLGLLGGAAYIAGAYFNLWPMPSWLTALAPTHPLPSGTTATGTAATGTTAAQTPLVIPWSSVTPADPSNALVSQLMVSLLATAGAATQPSGMLTFDQWNYFYNQIAGGFLTSAPGLNTTSQPITVLQFLSQGSWPNVPGLSGLGPYAPLPGGYQLRRSILQRPPRSIASMAGQNARHYRVRRAS